MQAQDYGGGLWGIGLRLPGGTEKVVEAAIAAKTIVRTWPMRGTLHFVAAGDVHWMLELLTPRILAGAAKRHAELELDDVTISKCGKVFRKALKGGGQLTREEMFARLKGEKISAEGPRGYHIMWRLAQERVLCFGARRGKQHTFALLDEWVPATKTWAREKALEHLTLRYFAGHGPATLQDFIWWSGLRTAEAREGLEAASVRLVEVKIDGVSYYMTDEAVADLDVTNTAFLLPGFDEYMLGYRDRSAALDPKHAPKIIPGSNGVFMPTMIFDGKVVGTWKRALTKKSVVVTGFPFGKITRAQVKAFEGEAERFGEYLGMEGEFRVAG